MPEDGSSHAFSLSEASHTQDSMSLLKTGWEVGRGNGQEVQEGDQAGAGGWLQSFREEVMWSGHRQRWEEVKWADLKVIH